MEGTHIHHTLSRCLAIPPTSLTVSWLPLVTSHPQPQKEIEASTRANSYLPRPRHGSHQWSSFKSLVEQGSSSRKEMQIWVTGMKHRPSPTLPSNSAAIT